MRESIRIGESKMAVDRAAERLDYSTSGLTIREALVDLVKSGLSDRVPPVIRWGGRDIQTALVIDVPKRGVVTLEFIDAKSDVEQGADLEVSGWIELSGGERVKRLRTWNDPALEPTVTYRYSSPKGKLSVWNVYRVRYPGGATVEERWTENAGLWVEQTGALEFVCHCSHGLASPPDFECLKFRVVVT